MSEETEQLAFWRGEFGNEYITRNLVDPDTLRARTMLWSEILSRAVGKPPRSVLEVGANIGSNLRAIGTISDAELWALEPNNLAREKLVTDKVVPASHALAGGGTELSLPDRSVDLVFTSGVLIHIHPDELLPTCTQMHRVSSRYIACIEYFSDRPVELSYREHSNKLFKRDFGAFWMDNFDDLRLLDYGFVWKRATGLDNLTWWLFEKGQ